MCFPNVSLLLVLKIMNNFTCVFFNNNFACVWYKEFKAGATRTVSGSSVVDWLLFGMWPNPAENTKNFIE